MGMIAIGIVTMGIAAFGIETMSLLNLEQSQLGSVEIKLKPHNHDHYKNYNYSSL